MESRKEMFPHPCPCRLVHTGHRSEEHTSELQSQSNLVCRLLLEKKKNNTSLLRSISTVTTGWLSHIVAFELQNYLLREPSRSNSHSVASSTSSLCDCCLSSS